MKSIRFKLIVAMLAKSLMVIAIVGLTSRWIMLNRFDNLVVDRAAENFMSEVVDYYLTYGSWEAARRNQTFLEFVGQTRPQSFGPGYGQLTQQSGSEPGGQIPAPRRFAFGGEPPRFVVADQSGVVLLDLARMQAGDQLTSSQMRNARPLRVNGLLIGQVVALERPALTDMEAQYLAAHESAWRFSLILALALAIPAGVILASYFSRPMHELTLALKAMQKGALRQSVPVRSQDELGQMAASFNAMSDSLASAYEELERSRAKLTHQATVLEQLSRTDELTRLPNRRAFDEQARAIQAQVERYDRPLTYALIDLDNFKRINDDFSHGLGDTVLREVAAMIRDSIRVSDVAARYGGDEFVIAFPETGIDGASRIVERLRKCVADFDWSVLAQGLNVTLSIGVAAWGYGQSLETALGGADAKLYAAKDGGRNRVQV